MKKLFFLLLFFYSVGSFSQNTTLDPTHEFDFGLNSHTSRDDAYFTHVDSKNDIILIGTTEVDVTFTDVQIIKTNSSLEEIWKKTISIPTNLSYDIPLRSFIGQDDSIYVIGRSSFRQSSTNGLIYILKYSATGDLVFEKYLGDFEGDAYIDFSFMEAFLSDDDTLSITFAPFDYQSYTGYDFTFVQFDSNGQQIYSYETTIQHDGGLDGLIDESGYYFISKNVVDPYAVELEFNYDLHTVDFNGNHNTYSISDDLFDSFHDVTIFGDNTFFRLDNDHVYFSCHLENTNDNISRVHFAKFLKSDGSLVHSIATPEDEKHNIVSDFISSQNGYTAILNNEDDSSLSFVTIDNGTMDITSEPNFIGTGFIKNKDDSFFVTRSNSQMTLFNANYETVNSFNTSNTFALVDFEKIDDNNLVVFGSTIETMYPGSVFYSQLNFHSEKISSTAVVNSYTFNGQGTSGNERQLVFADNSDNYYLLIQEKLGPRCLYIGCDVPPNGIVLVKLNQNFEKVWELDLTGESIRISDNSQQAKIIFDSNDNLYLNLLNFQYDGFQLFKITPEGNIVFKKDNVQHEHLVLDEQNDKIYTFSKVFFEYDWVNFEELHWTIVNIHDTNTGDLIQEYQYDDVRILNYHIENDVMKAYFISMIYNNWHISLYENDALLWTRDFDLHERDIYETITYENGDLLFFTSSSDIDDRRVHKLSLNNELTQQWVGGYNWDVVLHDNENIYVRDNTGQIVLYKFDTSLQPIGTTEYSSLDTFFKVKNGIVGLGSASAGGYMVLFDFDLNTIEYSFNGFIPNSWTSNSSGSFALSGNFGNQIPLQPWYSWSRAFVNKYDFDATLSTNSEDLVSNEEPFQLYPNPTADYINIHLKEDSVKLVELFDINGRFILSSQSNQLKISHLSSGIYLLKMDTTSGHKYNSKIIKE